MKDLELEMLEASHTKTQSTQARIQDQMIEDSRGDPERRQALIHWHDTELVPLLNKEWRLLSALEDHYAQTRSTSQKRSASSKS